MKGLATRICALCSLIASRDNLVAEPFVYAHMTVLELVLIGQTICMHASPMAKPAC